MTNQNSNSVKYPIEDRFFSRERREEERREEVRGEVELEDLAFRVLRDMKDHSFNRVCDLVNAAREEAEAKAQAKAQAKACEETYGKLDILSDKWYKEVVTESPIDIQSTNLENKMSENKSTTNTGKEAVYTEAQMEEKMKDFAEAFVKAKAQKEAKDNTTDSAKEAGEALWAKTKNHISRNRGKYGIVIGAAGVLGASYAAEKYLRKNQVHLELSSSELSSGDSML